MNQPQIEEAPVIVVFVGNHRVYEEHFEETLALDSAAGASTPKYVALLRKFVPLAFRRGPVGFHWLWKAALLPVVRLLIPVPGIPAVQRRFWLAKQVSLTAMNFMLAAEAAGLHTLPMEGFDTARVRRVLRLPRHWEPMLVVPLGHTSATHPPRKTRLPLERVVLRR